MTQRRRWRDRRRLSPWAVDSVVVVVLLALFAEQVLDGPRLQPGQRPTDAVLLLLTLAMIGPYLVHRRAPLTAAAISLTALLVDSLLHAQAYPGVNAFALLFGITLHTPDRRRRIAVFAATLATLTVAVWTQPAGVATTSTWVSTLLCATVAGLGGDNLRHRRARWAALEERARFVESEREERERRAVIEERLRIARELHDVVAHSMSVIAVQAGVGHHVLATQPDEARRALEAIETTSRTALTEMRRLLGVLREEGQPRASLSPAPGLDDLPGLVTQLREAGLDVCVTVSGAPPGPMAVPVGLTAYRIIQEALTNALRHGGPVASVMIEYGPAEVRVEITDDGRPGTPGRRRGREGTGHGLIGMRERVAVFGGLLTTGFRPGGGFRVDARLPLTRDPA